MGIIKSSSATNLIVFLSKSNIGLDSFAENPVKDSINLWSAVIEFLFSCLQYPSNPLNLRIFGCLLEEKLPLVARIDFRTLLSMECADRSSRRQGPVRLCRSLKWQIYHQLHRQTWLQFKEPESFFPKHGSGKLKRYSMWIFPVQLF